MRYLYGLGNSIFYHLQGYHQVSEINYRESYYCHKFDLEEEIENSSSSKNEYFETTEVDELEMLEYAKKCYKEVYHSPIDDLKEESLFRLALLELFIGNSDQSKLYFMRHLSEFPKSYLADDCLLKIISIYEENPDSVAYYEKILKFNFPDRDLSKYYLMNISDEKDN